MLAFAAALHDSLASLAHPAGGGGPTRARMGIAFGEAAFLLGCEPVSPPGSPQAPAEGGNGGGFVSVQGDVVNVAARMEAAAAPGVATVHGSAAARWAAEGPGRARPRCRWMECKGKGSQPVAYFDCATQEFLPDGPPVHPHTTPPHPAATVTLLIAPLITSLIASLITA
jgi:class 3 adenylate cyclase